MTGIEVSIEGPVEQCAGCERPVAVYNQKRGGAHLRVEYEYLAPNGDTHKVALSFHSLECFQCTYVIEKWDGPQAFIRWASEKVRYWRKPKRNRVEPKILELPINGEIVEDE